MCDNMPADVAGSHFGTPQWSARREFELIKLLCGSDATQKMRQLWLQKQRIAQQPAGGQSSQWRAEPFERF